MKNTSMIGGVLVAAMTFTGQAFAASTSFADPSTESWGGWTRGDANTSYVHWEEIGGPTVLDTLDLTPDAGLENATNTALITNNAGGFVTGSGLGGNIYSFSDAGDFTVSFDTTYSYTGPVTVALQIADLGTPLDQSSVLLNGIGYDSVTNLFSGSAGGPFGGAVEENLFLWTLSSAFTTYTFDFNATGSSLSLDAVSIDVGPSAAVSPVPVPAAAFLFAPALLGFMGLRRKAAKS